jgi:hypothetical protein
MYDTYDTITSRSGLTDNKAPVSNEITDTYRIIHIMTNEGNEATARSGDGNTF